LCAHLRDCQVADRDIDIAPRGRLDDVAETVVKGVFGFKRQSVGQSFPQVDQHALRGAVAAVITSYARIWVMA